MEKINFNGLVQRGRFNRAVESKFSRYCKVMSKDNDNVIYDDTVRDLLVEQGFDVSDIYEPRSVYTASKLYDALALFGPELQAQVIKDEHLNAGLSMAFKVFAKPRELSQHIEPLSGDGLLRSVKMEKSSGLPMLSSKADSYVYSLNRMKQILDGQKSPNPCIAYKRTQAKNKTRLVWGFPLEMTLMEGAFARPLTETFLRRRTCMAFGLKKPTLGAYLNYQVGRHKYKYCLDYSKFDTSISSYLISKSFEILATWFKKEDLDKFGWNQVIKYFITTPIVMPDGCLYTGKRHGVPSGSYFTQIIDSIVNIIILGAVSHKFNLKLDWRDIFVLGDDSIFGSNVKIELNEIAEFVKSHFGVTINVLKSSCDRLEFLGAIWINGLPTIEIDELIKKAIFPESFRDYRGIGKTNGAKQVLLSLAGQYVSGHALAPRNKRYDYSTVGLEHGTMDLNPAYMTGSDRYMISEGYGHLLNSMNSKNVISIPYRMLT